MRHIYLLVIIIFILGNDNFIFAQNFNFKNLELKFVDSTTFKSNIIYGFKKGENNVYFLGPVMPLKISDGWNELKLNANYDLKAMKFNKPIILEKNRKYLRVPLITYLEVDSLYGSGFEVFSQNDTVKVDLYFSPYLFKKYYVRPEDQ